MSDPRVRREAEALVQRGDQVTVLSLHEANRPEREVVEGVRVQRVPIARYRGAGYHGYVRGYLEFFARVLAWAVMHPAPDVVHVHTIPDALIFAAGASRLRGCRLVLDVHDLTPDLFALKFGTHSAAVKVLQLVERASLGFADGVITVHELYGSLLATRGVGPERVYVVMNVPDDRFFVSLRHDPRPAESEDVRVVYHGTLTERYGVDVLLEAFAGACREIPRLRLSVYGDGEYRPTALRMATRLGLNRGIKFSSGFIPVERVLPFLADADIGVVPNRQNPFTERILPSKLMEYAALGLPAIVSRTGLVQSYFSDDMVRYVAPASVDDLRRALIELATDPGTRRRLGTNIQRFSREHTWSRNKEELFCAIDGRPPHRLPSRPVSV